MVKNFVQTMGSECKSAEEFNYSHLDTAILSKKEQFLSISILPFLKEKKNIFCHRKFLHIDILGFSMTDGIKHEFLIP